MPFHVNDHRASRWATETLDELMPLVHDPNSNLAEIVPAVVFRRQHAGPGIDEFATYQYKSTPGGEQMETTTLPEWSSDKRIPFQHLTVEMLSWQTVLTTRTRIGGSGLQTRLFLQTAHCQCTGHARASTFGSHEQVDVETGVEYESMDQMRADAKSLGSDAVVNCTGLGAAKICNSWEREAFCLILIEKRLSDDQPCETVCTVLTSMMPLSCQKKSPGEATRRLRTSFQGAIR
jgi:hypothetical protein